MHRIVEPELMEDAEQAKAYAGADFEEGHSRIIELLDEAFPLLDISGEVLDLGCGPGDITFRLAHRFPKAKITAIDGSLAMLDLAEQRKKIESKTGQHIKFIHTRIPSSDIPTKAYDLIISTSFLHHLHSPEVLWQTIKKHANPHTKIFIADLTRPEDKPTARGIVNEYAKDEPAILQEDFYNSLLAAFTPEEVRDQLGEANLDSLSILVDRYLVISGNKG